MRAPLNIRTILAAMLMHGAVADAGMLGKLKAQELGSPDSSSGFRLVFTDGTASLVAAGEVGQRNQDSIARIARILPHWSNQSFVRFLFVAPRAESCATEGGCSPEQLLWQRVNAATVLIQEKAAANGQRLRFDLIGMAFADEFGDATKPALELPAVATGTAAIDLRTYLSRNSAGEPCRWEVLLSDPDLPPVVGQESDPAGIALPTNATVAVSDRASIRVGSPRPEIGKAAAFWESPKGKFCSAAALLAGSAVAVSPRPGRLHLVAVQEGDGEVRKFLSELGEGCRAGMARPGFLGNPPWPSIAKGIGDHLEYLPPGELRAPATGTASPRCQFTFLGTPPEAARASR